MSLGVAVITATLSGQPQTDKPPLPKGQMPDLGRPTKVGDELPLFDFDAYFESSPFTYNGRTLRIKHAMRLLSPFNYKVATTLSVDGGPFRNYGNPWWRKDAAGSK